MDTPDSRSSGGDIDGFFASGSPVGGTGGTGGYKARDPRAGGGAALTPVVKRRAILYDRSPREFDTSFVDTEAAAAAASALLAVRSSDGPKRCVCVCGRVCVLWRGREGWFCLYIVG